MLNCSKDKEFNEIIKDIVSNDTVLQMQNFKQHYNTNCFEHCKNVAYYSYLICKKLKLDYISMSRAAMLHDLFLYDWRIRQPNRKGLHAFTHPKEALKNASKMFELNNKEQDIILKHMWPLTIKLPKYKESYIIGFVDKYCAIQESIEAWKNNLTLKMIYRYAYLVLGIYLFYI